VRTTDHAHNDVPWKKHMSQMGLTTHHMSSMDPQKTDIQQIQSIILIEEAKNFLKIAMLSLLAMGQFMVVLGVFQMKQISK
jgi:hypothetical protein